MLVQNVSGVVQVSREYTLPPGQWVDVELSVADELLRSGIVRVDFTEDPLGIPKLFWLSPFSKEDGYGVVASNLLRVLCRNGLNVFPRKCWFDPGEDLDDDVGKLLQEPLPGALQVGFCLAQANHFWKLPTPCRVGYTMYETSGPLERRPEWAHDLQYIDYLLVPSAFCKEVFSFANVPTKTIPLPVHDDFFNVRKRKRGETFTFVTYGTLTGRKSPLELIDCFGKAFPPETYPDVRLSLKTRLGYLGLGPRMMTLPQDPRIEVIDEGWSRSKLLSWLYAADAMIFPSKGEGFGMPPREAIATGLPTVISDNTGLSDIANEDYLWLIPKKGEAPCALGGNWVLPDWDVVVDTMRALYHSPYEAYAKGAASGRWFKEYYGPDRLGKRFVKFFETLDPGLSSERLSREAEGVLPEEYFQRIAQKRPSGFSLAVGDAAFTERVGASKSVSDLAAVPAMNRHFQWGFLGDSLCFYGIEDLWNLLRRALFYLGKVLACVPTPKFLGYYGKDARVLSYGDWEFILKSFDATVNFLGPKREFLLIEVSG